MVEWLVHLSTATVVWVQSPAVTRFIFPNSRALGPNQPHKKWEPENFQNFSEISWEDKETQKEIGLPHQIMWWPRTS